MKKILKKLSAKTNLNLAGWAWAVRSKSYQLLHKPLTLIVKKLPRKAYPEFGPPRKIIDQPAPQHLKKTLPPPRTITPQNPTILENAPTKELRWDLPKASTINIYQLPNIIIDGKTAAITTREKEFITNLSRYTKCADIPIPWDHKIFLDWTTKTIPPELPPSILLSSANDQVYYHWLFEVLPILQTLEQNSHDLTESHYLVRHLKHFAQELLETLNINPQKQCTVMDAASRYPVQQATVIQGIDSYTRIPSTSEWIRKKLNLENRDQDIKILYIERPESDARTIINQKQLIKKIQKLGGTSIDFSTLSVSEQAHYMNRSKIILSAHGSALANIIFCQKNTHIIELFARNYVRHLYPAISAQLGLQHSCIVDDGKPTENSPGIYDNININHQIVIQHIQNILNTLQQPA